MSYQGVVHPAQNHLGVRLWNWVGHDRAGSLPLDQVKEKPIMLTPKHSTPITCGKTPRYDQNVVLPNGDVVLCCMDYDNKHVLGNLNTHTIDQIRQQPAFVQLVEENARSCFSTNSLCRTCTDAVPQ
jgi:radical SAM protein with 4Fe4S-binding SPASM domain